MIKKALKYLLKAVKAVVVFIFTYGLLCLLLPMIRIPSEKTNEEKSIEIYITTNGAHTDIVVPTHSEYINWEEKVLPTYTKGGKAAQWLAFGWGDKGFYLNTPTWADLKFSTAVKAAFWMSESAMHCTYESDPTYELTSVAIQISSTQYKRLISYIDGRFDKDAQGRYIPITTDAAYGNDDTFYEAKGTYNFTYTCNIWANYALRAAGQQYALWTATDMGIFRHYKE